MNQDRWRICRNCGQRCWVALTVAADENFFDLGGTSLLLIEMHARLTANLHRLLRWWICSRFQHLASGSAAFRGAGRQVEKPAQRRLRGQRQRAAMLARRPGMNAHENFSRRTLPERMDPDERSFAKCGRHHWSCRTFSGRGECGAVLAEPVRRSRIGSSRLQTQELEDGLTAAQRGKGKYVAARAMLDNVDMFDAEFFRILPREAESPIRSNAC